MDDLTRAVFPEHRETVDEAFRQAASLCWAARICRRRPAPGAHRFIETRWILDVTEFLEFEYVPYEG